MAPDNSTEQNFRANLSQFRWARGNNDDSQPQDSQGSGNNPFSRFYNAVGGGYIPLRSSERSNEDEAYFALSRWERCGRYLVPFIPNLGDNYSSSLGLVQIIGIRRVPHWCRRMLLCCVPDAPTTGFETIEIRSGLQVSPESQCNVNGRT